jgi:hypothetical protein
VHSSGNSYSSTITNSKLQEYITNASLELDTNDEFKGNYKWWDLDGYYCYDNELNFLQKYQLKVLYNTSVDDVYRFIKSIKWEYNPEIFKTEYLPDAQGITVWEPELPTDQDTLDNCLTFEY